MDPYHEKLLDRADHLRTERKDREMEEAQDQLEAETPQTTLHAYYAFPPSGALGAKFKVVDVSFARDLERRLNLARAALKEILFIRRAPLPLLDLDEARSIAKKTLEETA